MTRTVWQYPVMLSKALCIQHFCLHRIPFGHIPKELRLDIEFYESTPALRRPPQKNYQKLPTLS